MNVIGEFGKYVIEYQSQIQFSLIIILAVLLIFFIIRAAIHAKKKRELLSKISDTVTEINTTVNRINEKKSEVVYIDNRVPQAPICPAGPIVHPETVKPEANDCTPADIDTGAAAEAETNNLTKVETEFPKSGMEKFFDRNCAVSKSGREYSIEELKNQIKE